MKIIIILLMLLCITNTCYSFDKTNKPEININIILINYLESKIKYINEFPEYKIINPELWKKKRKIYEHISVHYTNIFKCGYHYKLSIAPVDMIINDCVMR